MLHERSSAGTASYTSAFERPLSTVKQQRFDCLACSKTYTVGKGAFHFTEIPVRRFRQSHSPKDSFDAGSANDDRAAA